VGRGGLDLDTVVSGGPGLYRGGPLNGSSGSACEGAGAFALIRVFLENWPGYSIDFRYHSATYKITVKKSPSASAAASLQQALMARVLVGSRKYSTC